MVKGTYDPVKELPLVPDVPALLTDSVYRMCGAPPDSLCTISHAATGVIHLFPWSHGLNAGLTGGQSPMTYGLLSKVPSPKEARDRVKQVITVRLSEVCVLNVVYEGRHVCDLKVE